VNEDWSVRRDGAVLTFTLTRNRKLNAVSNAMRAGLREAVDTLAEDPDLRVLLIAAEGRFFTAGIDIADIAEQPGIGEDGLESGLALRRHYRRLHLIFDEIEAIEKPVVLAAQGPCLGIGVELAASCDFRIASDRATFSLPEVPNLAVIPGSGGVSRLTRLVGPHWARWMALAGESVTAERALLMGFVHEVYPDATFSQDAADFAQRLASMSGEAMGLCKLAIDVAASSERTVARDFDRVANTLLLSSDDHRARVREFNERSTT
jgi:enoyl-CoA hydratase/carnithine racemase